MPVKIVIDALRARWEIHNDKSGEEQVNLEDEDLS